jgi:Tfp pilus assembly protein PilX
MHYEEIQRQIAELIAENSKGYTALFEAEKALAEAEYTLDTTEQKAFLSAEGSVADRTAIAKLKAADNRLQRDLRRAELNRVKVKVKAIETALMALATQAKLIQSEGKL